MIDSSAHFLNLLYEKSEGKVWTYKGKEINGHADLHPECTDFVYMIKYDDGRFYIGKKAVRAVRKYPPLKGYKRCRRKMKNLPFVKYQGSHELAADLVPVEKEIMYQCSQRKAATYMEMHMLVEHNAIFRENYLNENISGVFFRNSLDGLIIDD